MMTMHYRPLSSRGLEIRVLVLHSADDTHANNELKCTLSYVYLDQDPPPLYYALSYVWGSNEKTSQIRVGHELVPVTPSLARALLGIRETSKDLTLWVDAVCINQNDIDERNQQVKIMGLIYRKATTVLAWLDLSSNDGDSLVNTINKLQELEKKTPLSIIRRARSAAANVFVIAYISNHLPRIFEPDPATALIRYFSSAFWSRTWIMQELQLAAHVQVFCGSRRLDLDVLQSPFVISMQIYAPKLLGKNRTSEPIKEQQVLATIHRLPTYNMMSKLRLKGSKQVVHQLTPAFLLTMAGLNATDPRDKIFGFLGLVDASVSQRAELIEPDYRKTVQKVYTDYAVYAISNGACVDILRMAGRDMSSLEPERIRLSRLPSWVPDWQSRYITWGHRQLCIPCWSLKGAAEISEGGQQLHVLGFEIGEVARIWSFSRGIFPFWINQYYKEEFDEFVRDFLSGPLIDDETPLSVYHRLMTGQPRLDLLVDRSKRETSMMSIALFLNHICKQTIELRFIDPGRDAAATRESLIKALILALLGPNATTDDRQQILHKILRLTPEADTRFFEIVLEGLEAAVPFQTTTGRMGFASHKIQQGDHLCCLPYHPNPFALCPRGDKFENHGECFILDLDFSDPEQCSDFMLTKFTII